jgi:hypothetical protein
LQNQKLTTVARDELFKLDPRRCIRRHIKLHSSCRKNSNINEVSGSRKIILTELTLRVSRAMRNLVHNIQSMGHRSNLHIIVTGVQKAGQLILFNKNFNFFILCLLMRLIGATTLYESLKSTMNTNLLAGSQTVPKKINERPDQIGRLRLKNDSYGTLQNCSSGTNKRRQLFAYYNSLVRTKHKVLTKRSSYLISY